MKGFRDCGFPGLLALVCLFFFAEPSLAYLDGSAGAYLTQILTGGVLVFLMAINRFKGAIVERFFKRRPGKEKQE